MQEFVYRGAIKNLVQVVSGRPLLFTQRTAYKLLKSCLDPLAPCVWTEMSANPKREEIQAAQDALSSESFDCIIALGGGSAIDFAKGFRFYTGKQLPLIAIPSTAGSGSEATQFAVIYVNGRKTSLDSPSVLPDVAIVDSQLIENAPRALKASCAMDAFAQAIESFWAKGATSESKIYALEAIHLCRENLVQAVNTADPVSNERMAQASHLAGKAINISRTTAAHALSYKITSTYGIPHGHAVALTLPQIFEANLDYIKDGKMLLAALGISRSDIRPYFNDFMHAIGLENDFAMLGITDLKAIVNSVDPQRLGNNPRNFTQEELLQNIKNAGR